MTAQIPHRLHNDLGLDLGNRALSVVILGPVEKRWGWGSGHYPHQIKPQRHEVTVSSNWDGFICSYRLTKSGTLILEHYEYPHTSLSPTPVKVRSDLSTAITE